MVLAGAGAALLALEMLFDSDTSVRRVLRIRPRAYSGNVHPSCRRPVRRAVVSGAVIGSTKRRRALPAGPIRTMPGRPGRAEYPNE